MNRFLSRIGCGVFTWITLEPASPNESGIRRAALSKDKLVSEPAPGIHTIPDLLDYTARVHGDKPSMGWREVIDVIEESKEVTKTINGRETKENKTWKYFKLGGYQYISYIEVRERAHDIAKALLELGIEKGDIWNIYATTRWVNLIPFKHTAEPAVALHGN
jgi:long-chain acyl-CoA synthetase